MFSKFFIYRPIFAAVVSILIVLLGGIALLALPIGRYPEIAPPTIVVSAVYPGANAETIAETVATPIEQEVNGVEGMLYMTSVSSADGSMTLKITFETGSDLDMANVLVQNRVALAEPKLPEEVRRLGVTVKKRSSEITALVNLYSPTGEYDEAFLVNYANQNIRDELTRVDGVGDVTIFGSAYGMRIWLQPDRLRALGLTTNDVVAAVREQNVQVAAGKIGEAPAPAGQAFELTVNTEGRLSEVAEFEEIIIRTGETGGMVRLRDVARVELGSDAYAMQSLLNNGPTCTMGIYQLPGANAIEAADGIAATLERLSESFPEGLQYQVSYDATKVIRASLREVVITLFITLVLVVLTVYIFLQNFRATLIPTLTIPVSLIGTFMVMAAMGYSLNILTLFGLILVIGIVVDDAIVVVENTTRLIEEEGLPSREAAVKSMQEVTGPVIATTLVLLAVFVPTVFLAGIIGELFRQFAVTISIATVFSSINALTLSPALCGLLLKPAPKKQFFLFRWFNRGLGATTTAYVGAVRLFLRGAVVGVLIFGGLVALAIYGFMGLPSGFVPQEDEGYFLVNVQLPDGASMERTLAVTSRVNEILLSTEGVADIVTINGFSAIDESRASNAAAVFVMLDDWDERPGPELHQNAIIGRVNAQLAAIQEGVAIGFPMPSLPGLGTSGGFSLQLQDRGGVGLGMLQNVAQEAALQANQAPGIAPGSTFTTFRAGVPQLHLDIDREQIKQMNMPLQSVFDALAAYLGSVYINDFNLFGRIYKVKVQAESFARAEPGDIESLEVRNAAGQMVPLGAVLSVDEIVGPQVVTHHNIYASARINGQPAPGFSSGQAIGVMESVLDSMLPPSMGYAWIDLSFQEKAASGAASIVFLFSILLVYLVLAAQYESWSIPLAVVLGVPVALLGATAAVLLRGYDSNVYTQIGIVLLIGLSAKTAILIVEFAKVEREAGKSIFDAAVSAARLRFRAVLMTAFSFILGVIPLVVATGAGAESRKILGSAVLGGMLVATVAGVLTVPMLYLIIQWISEKLRGSRSAATPSSAPGLAAPSTASPESPV